MESWLSLRATALLVVISAGCAGHAAWSAAIPPSVNIPPLTYDFPTTAVADSVEDEEDAWSSASPARLDLYGNEIQAAVEDYRVDPRGELYEHHSPDTAVLRISSPEL